MPVFLWNQRIPEVYVRKSLKCSVAAEYSILRQRPYERPDQDCRTRLVLVRPAVSSGSKNMGLAALYIEISNKLPIGLR